MKKVLTSLLLLSTLSAAFSTNALEITGDNDTDFVLSSSTVAAPLLISDWSTKISGGDGIRDAKLELAAVQDDAMNRMAGEAPTKALLDVVAYLQENVEQLEDSSYEEAEAFLLSL